MFTLTKIDDANYIINAGGFYHFAQIVYILLIIAVIFNIVNFVCNAIFLRKHRDIFINIKETKKLKILNTISLIFFPITVIGMIVIISFL